MVLSSDPKHAGEDSCAGLRVVVVDDDPLILAVTRRLLVRSGYDVIPCDDPRAALREVLQRGPFAVVTDLHMPDLDGAELLRLVRSFAPRTRRVLYTGESQLAELARAVSPLVADAIVTKADGTHQLPLALSDLRLDASRKEGMAEARKLALSLLTALSSAAAGSVETLDHALRVARAAHRLGRLARLDESQLHALELGALLHDVGMACLPEELLQYTGIYDVDHWRLVHGHPRLGADLLRGSELLAGALPVVLYHHERFDGAGYPHRLAGEEIPLAARLFAVVDTYEALTHPRPHVSSRDLFEARAELLRVSGTQLDPDAVQLFLGVDPDEWKRPSIVPAGPLGT
jgi:response regulator RpfG family c-di-GMP phosphodiesterase